MLRRSIVAGAIIFILWSIIDFVMHGIILGSAYAESASLWRPMAEMNIWLIYLVTVVSVAVFTAIYALFVQDKKVATALRYGLLFGVGAGFSMGYGSYAAMPISQIIAHTWFFGTLIKSALGGLVLGAIVKK
jgi:hypothetical protein